MKSYLRHKYGLLAKFIYQIKNSGIVQATLGLALGLVLHGFDPLLALGVVVLLVILAKKQFKLFSLLMCCGFIYAELRFGYHFNQNIEHWYDQSFVGTAKVMADGTDNGFKQKVILELENVPGKTLLTTQLYPHLWAGQVIKLEQIVLEEPENYSDFDYKDYLRQQHIYFLASSYEFEIVEENYSLLSTLAAEVRKFVKKSTAKHSSLRNAALLNGLIIGSRESLDSELKESLSKTGTSHIVAVSGYNVTLTLTACLMLAGIVDRKLLLKISQFILVFFLFIVGFDNLPALRAGLMGLVFVHSLLSGRPGAIYLNILYASCLMLLINPLVWKSVSFQLSIAAFLGMAFFSNIFSSMFPSRLEVFSENFSTTVAVMVTTLPITVLNFGTTSLVSVFVNTLVLPLVPMATILGIVSVILDLFSQTLSSYLYCIVGVLLNIITKVIISCGKLNFAATDSIELGLLLNLGLVFLAIFLDFRQFYEMGKKEDK